MIANIRTGETRFRDLSTEVIPHPPQYKAGDLSFPARSQSKRSKLKAS